jgi:hypothetical protein
MNAIRRLERVGCKLEEWRRTHRAPSPIPQELWSQAVELAAVHGVYRTARALRLDYGALKRKVEARYGEVAPRDAAPTFVEVLSPLSGDVAECAFEVQAAGGGTLRVAMKNVSSAVLSSIIREFGR